MQAGLLYETLSGQTGAYVQQVLITCHEQLDEDALRVAWLALVQRHEALRTSFVIGETAVLQQRVHQQAEPGIVTVDWRELGEEDRRRRWEELLAAERQTGFEPAHPPLMRVAICRLKDALTRMLWTYHHAILDGRSRVALLRELFDLYDDARAGRTTPWVPPPSYRRFAEWAATRGADSETEAFWREALRGIEQPTPAPGASRRDGASSGSGSLAQRFDAEFSRRLREVAKASDVTVSTILQGAFGLLLAQEADCDDLLFVTTRAGRRSAPFDAREMAGMLMVTSPVRLRIAPDATVGQWLRQVRAFGQAVRDFEHVPLSQALGWSDIVRPHPIAETMFSYENASMNTTLRASDPAWQRRDVQLVEQLDFALTLEAFGDVEILVKVLYDRGRVPDSEARRVMRRYEALVRSCIERQRDTVAAVSSLSALRRRALAGEAVKPPPSKLLPDRIRERIGCHPDRVAVEHAGKRLTYGELGARVEDLAAQLAALGAGRGTVVAIAMARTPDMISALLAVHHIGAAYMPLDPRNPAERNQFMLDDSGAAVVVCDPWSREVLPDLGARGLVVAGVAAAPPAPAPPLHVTEPHDLSHVIYTSGSTGQPKGVLVEHRSVAQLTAWAELTFTDAERDGVLASTSLNFDLSVFEILVTLALGGRVVLVEDVLALADPEFRADVAFVNSVPSAVSALTRTGNLPDTVRTVALAGEALPATLVDRLYAHRSIDAVWNLYGPTEDTTYSTAYRCKPGLRPLIGRPLPGTQSWVVDRHLHPVPEGVSGELLLGGVGLAKGYLGRDELTADRFVEVAFEEAAPTRAYRTGDRARWSEDGELDYLGRLDDQVKIRGVRVEPGELEHAVRALDGVQDAAVLARGEDGDRSLVAYVVGPGLDPASLRHALARRLPSALVPDAVVVLESLPVTSNGKLDRRALPEPDRGPRAIGEAVAMGAQMEALAELWIEMLELPAAPGPDDDFFALGGDSLAALQLLTAIEDRFGCRLSVRTLLASTRLREQAAAIVARQQERVAGTLIPLRAMGEEPPFFCVLTDHRAVIGLRNVLPATLTDQPVFGVQAIDPAVASWRSSTIEQIAAACLRAVRASRPSGPYRLGGHSLGGLVAFEMACELARDGERVELLVLLDTISPEGFRWPGRITGRHRLLRDESTIRRLRGYANLVRTGIRHTAAMARGEVLIRSWPRGFDDPWDQAGATRVMRRYHPPRLAAPVTVISTPLSELHMGSCELGWRRHVDGSLTTRRLPGGHNMIFAEPDVQALAAALSDAFAALSSPLTSRPQRDSGRGGQSGM
jgi:amino acid adenylation domain-containing protein